MSVPLFGPDPFEGRGHLISQTETTETWVSEIAPGHWAKCVNEYVGPILDENRRDFNDAGNKRFEDGAVVARYPLQFYFDKIVPAKKAGDTEYIKRILNDSDYSKLRTRPGRV